MAHDQSTIIRFPQIRIVSAAVTNCFPPSPIRPASIAALRRPSAHHQLQSPSHRFLLKVHYGFPPWSSRSVRADGTSEMFVFTNCCHLLFGVQKLLQHLLFFSDDCTSCSDMTPAVRSAPAPFLRCLPAILWSLYLYFTPTYLGDSGSQLLTFL